MKATTYHRMNAQADRDAANCSHAQIRNDAERAFPEVFARANRILRAYEASPKALRNRAWMEAAQDMIDRAKRSIVIRRARAALKGE